MKNPSPNPSPNPSRAREQAVIQKPDVRGGGGGLKCPLTHVRGSDTRGSDMRDREGADTCEIAFNIPAAYFITFTCYGTWLHGSESGSVDRNHNISGSPFLPADTRRSDTERKQMNAPPGELNERQRKIVLRALREVCARRGWNLFAAHVRSNHAHVIVQTDCAPEKAMADFKAYATRMLRKEGRETGNGKMWTRHGSTRYLWKPGDIEAAIRYVVHEQGEPMAVWFEEEADDGE